MADPTDEANKGSLRLDFDRRLSLQFRNFADLQSPLTPDCWLIARWTTRYA
jgi:hypothetical protein